MSKWYTCEVVKAGSHAQGNSAIYLSDRGGSFAERPFATPPGAQKQMLATALTAIAAGLPVTAELQDPPDSSTPIQTLYVLRG